MKFDMLQKDASLAQTVIATIVSFSEKDILLKNRVSEQDYTAPFPAMLRLQLLCLYVWFYLLCKNVYMHNQCLGEIIIWL